MADRYGFSFTEICIALEKFDNDSRAALTWLQTEWEKLVDVVISTVKTEGQRSQHNDVGELSREEAQEALRECGGELVPAVKKCTAKRRAMVSCVFLSHVVGSCFLPFWFFVVESILLIFHNFVLYVCEHYTDIFLWKHYLWII